MKLQVGDTVTDKEVLSAHLGTVMAVSKCSVDKAAPLWAAISFPGVEGNVLYFGSEIEYLIRVGRRPSMKKDKLCILFSGGMDSYIAYRKAVHEGLDPVLMRVSLGHPYNDKEEAAIKSLGLERRVISVHLPVVNNVFGNVPTKENYLIPGRNMLLALVACMAGANRVWLSSCRGEMSWRAKDKNKTFLHLMSGICSFVFNDDQGEVLVETPFEKMSKVDTVSYALSIGVTKEELLKTSSCLSPIHIPDPVGGQWVNCGTCKACLRRAGVLFQFDMADKCYVDPISSPEYMELMEEAIISGYDKARVQEILPAYEARLKREKEERKGWIEVSSGMKIKKGLRDEQV